jgi:hypothetical protein
MLRRVVLFAIAASLAAAPVFGQEGRARRVETQPAAAVRTPRADVAAAPGFAKLPFVSGERLSYDVVWNNKANAATVVLSVGERKSYFGKEAFPIEADVQTVGLVKFIANVDATFKSYADPKTLLPHRAEQSTSINGKVDKGEVVFDRTKQVAVANGRTLKIGPETGDMLALFYRFRATPMKAGESVVLDGYDGKTRTQVKVAVEEREQVQTAGGSREAFRVAFLPYKNGAPSDDLHIRVWYTADASRVPVLVTASPDFGDVKMTLRDSRNAKL